MLLRCLLASGGCQRIAVGFLSVAPVLLRQYPQQTNRGGGVE